MSKTNKIAKHRHLIIRMIDQYESCLARRRELFAEVKLIKASDREANIDSQKTQIVDLSEGMRKLLHMVSSYMDDDLTLNDQIMVDGIVYVSQGGKKGIIRVDTNTIFKA